MSKEYKVRSSWEWEDRGVIENEIELSTPKDAMMEMLNTIDKMEQRIAELENRNIKQMLIDAGHYPRR